MKAKSIFFGTLTEGLMCCYLGVFLCSCKTSPTGPHITGNVQLATDYVACTEVWLKLSVTNNLTGGQFKITRDGDTVLTGMISGADTVVIDTTVQAERTYTYRGYRLKNGLVSDTSLPLQVTTLDTTSANFAWQTFTFGGDYGSCVLHDVAIINDTLAYAVGEIYLADSSNGQPDPQPYNLAIWNGESWRLQKVAYHYEGQINYQPFRAIYALSVNDIWLGGNGLLHFDGSKFSEVLGFNSVWGPYWIESIWGSPAGEVCVVGDSGSIAWYNGYSWQKIQSGTSLDVYDIFGSTDPKTGKDEILAACTRNYPIGHALLSISGTTAAQLSVDPIQYELFSVWFVPNRHYYLVGDGIFEKNSLSEAEWKNGPLDITHYGTTRIRGSALNDIMAVGAFGDCLHFNGMSWKSYTSTTTLANGAYTSVAIKGNLVIAVGGDNPRAVAIVGRR